MSDQTVSLLIEALVDQAGEVARVRVEADRLMGIIAQYRAPVVDAEPEPPTIARGKLIAMEIRMSQAAQVLKRGRNAELSRDLDESAQVVGLFLRDTRGKK